MKRRSVVLLASVLVSAFGAAACGAEEEIRQRAQDEVDERRQQAEDRLQEERTRIEREVQEGRTRAEEEVRQRQP